MRKSIIELQDGKEVELKLTSTINFIAVNEMRALIDGNELAPSYNYDWLTKKILKIHSIEPNMVKSYKEVVEKVKQAFHVVKSPSFSAFNVSIDTYSTKELGTRLVKISHDTPEDFRKKLTRQKKDVLVSRIDAFNTRITERNRQIGFSGKELDYHKD